jgi:formylglycine-generating enzyme required for sulfatase activity
MMVSRYLLLLAVSLATFSVIAQTNSTVHRNIPASFGDSKILRDCAECPEMMLLPAGTFLMGSPSNEQGHYDEEGPQRLVQIPAFAVGKYDVTRRQWKDFAKATHRTTSKGCDYSLLPKESEGDASWNNLGFVQDDSHPVVCVSWDDAHDYMRWLTQRSGHTYRLLTEAEWEYAARAGSTTPYPWGSIASHEYANYGGDDHAGYGVASGRDKWVATSPAGSFPPNAFGLFDMHGNVMTWVEDCFSNTYARLPTDGSAYVVASPIQATGYFASMNGTSSCSYRMLRGGCWGDTPAMIRSASRNLAPAVGQALANYRSSGLGIRVARNADPPADADH